MNIIKRLSSPTPNFFKKVRAIALTLAAAGTALLTAQSQVDGFVLPHFLEVAAQWFIVGGIVASAVATTTMDDSK